MTDDTRAKLRAGIEGVVRAAVAGAGNVHALSLFDGTSVGVYAEEAPRSRDHPPLTTAQVLALSVLLGAPNTLTQALADYMIDSGHEYAAAVAVQAAERAADPCDGMAAACSVGAITSVDSLCRMQAYRHAAESIRKTARAASLPG